MRQRLLWKLLLVNSLPVIGIIILAVWLAIDQLAADYFTTLMRQYHVAPTDANRMFLTAVHRYLVWATLIALALALCLTYLLTHRLLRPLFEMSTLTREISAGKYEKRVEIVSRDELGELGVSFNRMADSLEQIETLRKKMVADVSHELRTPLTNLRGYLEALSDEVVPPSTEIFRMLEREVLRLVHLVEDLQQLAKADAAKGYLNRQEISIKGVVGEVLDLYRPDFQAKSIEVQCEVAENLLVHADRDKLLQAVRNLVDNAWKYTPQGGRVEVKAQTSTGEVRVVFSNSGSEIAEKDLPFIFERFYRSDSSRSRERGGAGIGLAIVKELIEAHGGRVGAESGDGVTRVWFTLPL